LISSQSEILKKDVYLIEKIEKESNEKLSHLKALYLIRPTEKNLAYLFREVKDPKYSEYYICMVIIY
jgi:vacuolar protein sorting-associated protein 45